MTYLLSHEAQNVTYNAYNQNALDVAIEAGKEPVVMCIAEHTRWAWDGELFLWYDKSKMWNVAIMDHWRNISWQWCLQEGNNYKEAFLEFAHVRHKMSHAK